MIALLLTLDQFEEKLIGRQRKLRPKSDKDMKIYKKDSQNYKQSTSKLRARRSEKLKKPKFLENGGFL